MPQPHPVDPLRVLQVSDTHLAARAPFSIANWRAVSEFADTAADLVVHTGDISLDGGDDLAFSWREIDRLTAPWRAVPGNHDIGDPEPAADPVDASRRARYHASFGDGSWALVERSWNLVGLDVQTLTSTLPAAAELWDWLPGALATGLPTALFIHRPLHPLVPGDTDDPMRYVTEPTRSRLLAVLGQADVRLVASGHVHQWREGVVDGVRHVWAPSAWASIPDHVQPVIGRKVVGAVLHTLRPDGTVSSELVVPTGVAQVTSGIDFPSPFAHP